MPMPRIALGSRAYETRILTIEIHWLIIYTLYDIYNIMYHIMHLHIYRSLVFKYINASYHTYMLMAGIEPALLRWKRNILPLNYMSDYIIYFTKSYN